MKIFIKDGKTNFVDESDCYVGFDDQWSSCCESFGYYFLGDEPTEETIGSVEGQELTEFELSNFYFERSYFKEFPESYGGGYVVFRLVHRRLERDEVMRRRERGEQPSLYLVLFNHHNGYYSHGFDFGLVGGDVIQSSCI